METSAPAESASMKAFVPERAMVPRLLIRSALVIPIPESVIVRVLAVLSGTTRMKSSGCASRRDLSVRPSKRILSSASLELEMSSRRKISLFE